MAFHFVSQIIMEFNLMAFHFVSQIIMEFNWNGVFLTISTCVCDAAEAWQLGFQGAASLWMQGMDVVDQHDIFWTLRVSMFCIGMFIVQYGSGWKWNEDEEKISIVHTGSGWNEDEEKISIVHTGSGWNEEKKASFEANKKVLANFLARGGPSSKDPEKERKRKREEEEKKREEEEKASRLLPEAKNRLVSELKSLHNILYMGETPPHSGDIWIKAIKEHLGLEETISEYDLFWHLLEFRNEIYSKTTWDFVDSPNFRDVVQRAKELQRIQEQKRAANLAKKLMNKYK